MRNYNNPHCTSTRDFENDLRAVNYLLRAMNRYIDRNQCKPELMLNHTILLYNVFGSFATDMILFSSDDKHLPTVKTLAKYLYRIEGNEVIQGIDLSQIDDDKYIQDELSKL